MEEIKYNKEWLISQVESGVNLNFLFFWGHTNAKNEESGKFCLSQWYPSPFSIQNITYKTCEHYMMAQKALLFDDLVAFEKIILADSPKEVKALGRTIQNFDESKWNENKFLIVTIGNIHKFNQNKKFKEFLLKSNDSIIVEASPVDAIWGNGMAEDHNDAKNPKAWRGENLLGFALMEVRDVLNYLGDFENPQNVMLAPWNKYPGKNTSDDFYKKGEPEKYLLDYYSFIMNMSEKEQMIYEFYNPMPYNWI